METLTRGQLARASGVGSEAIRFYERQGLLPEPKRTAAGYRSFTVDSIQRIKFIRRAKSLGFSLQEIAELLALQDDAAHSDRGQIKALAEHKLTEIDAKLRDLQRMRNILADLSAQCSGRGALSGCPIIGALNDTEPPLSPATHPVRDAQ